MTPGVKEHAAEVAAVSRLATWNLANEGGLVQVPGLQVGASSAPRVPEMGARRFLLRAVRIVVARELEQQPVEGLAALGVERCQ